MCLLLTLPSFADDAEELTREMQEFQQSTLKQLQLIHEKAKGPGDQIGQLREKAVKLATNETFMKAVEEVWSHPKRSTVLLVNLGFFIFMVLVKAWRQSKARNWFTKMIVGFVFTLITWAGMIFLVPWIVLGNSYKILITNLINTFFTS
jgi:hypothetical protein